MRHEITTRSAGKDEARGRARQGRNDPTAQTWTSCRLSSDPPRGGGGGGVTTDLWNVSEMNPGESWCDRGSHICKLLRGGEVTLGVWCWFGFFFLNGELDGFLSFFILLLLAGLNVLSTEGRRQATLRRIWRKGWQSRGMTAMACSPRGRECFELARKRLRRLQCA